MSTSTVPVPISSEDDRWISIVSAFCHTIYGSEVKLELYYKYLSFSTNGFYRNAEKKMLRLYLLVIVSWKHFNIHRHGINTLHQCIR